MTTYVAIANLAASKIGEDDQLRSPGDDTHLGRSVAAVWNQVRRAAIRDHSWNFATRRKDLAAAALDSVPYPWGYSFPMPAESVRLLGVLNLSRPEYQLEGGSILCNAAGPLYIKYLIDVEETALWDDLFVEAFACRLAFQVGPRIAGSAFDKSGAWTVYQDALNQAKRVDARENPPVEMVATDWELARGGYGGRGYGCRSSSDWA